VSYHLSAWPPKFKALRKKILCKINLLAVCFLCLQSISRLSTLISLCNYLVGSADEVQVMAVEELADHVGPEGEGDPAVILSPALYILIWV